MIFGLKIKKTDIVAFLVFVLLFAVNIFVICQNSLLSSNFDSQEILTWNFTSLHGFFPNRDVFYPYGLLIYYKDISLFTKFLFFIQYPIMLMIIYIILKKLFDNKTNFFITLSFLLIFIFNSVGIYSLQRFGIFIFVSLWAAYFFYSHKLINRLHLLTFGIIVGISYDLFFDQGIYLGIIIVFLYLYNSFLKHKFNVIKAIKDISVLVIGIFISLLPYLIFLYINNALISNINLLTYLNDVQLFAKTPFYNFITQPDNIFTLAILFCAICYLIWNLIYKSKVIKFSYYLIFTIILVILILEFKSIIRLIDDQIILPAYILGIILISEILTAYKSLKLSKYLINSILIILFIFVNFSIGIGYGNIINNKYSIREGRFFNLAACTNMQINKPLYSDSEFKEIHSKIISIKTDSNVYSFPANPIFYILFNQKPPFFNTIYEASSKNAQYQIIDYMKSSKIDFIIFDYENKAIQDNVPNTIRTPYLFSYILNNYAYNFKSGKYIILERKSGFNIFDNAILSNQQPYLDSLKVNLEFVPLEEGKYKFNRLILDSNILLSTSNMNITNSYLEKNKLNTNNLVFALKPIKKSEFAFSSFKVTTTDNFIQDIKFKPCTGNQICLIDLSRLPLFYKNRIIKNIKFDSNYAVDIIKLHKYESDLIW